MADIPHELLMTEIVSRLPAKSVCRFRCVSKPWCELISDSNFIKLHLKRAISRDERDILASDYEEISRQLECTLHSEDGNVIHTGIADVFFSKTNISWIDGNSFAKLLTIKDPFGETFGGADMSKLLGSCNGIVCLLKQNQVCLINPCTKEYKFVKFDKDVNFFRNAALGFGYDAIQDDFKLVQIVETDHYESEISVFSVNNKSTNKASDVQFTICTQKGRWHNDEKRHGCYLDGAIYWVVIHKYKRAEQVIAFELGTNEVREIPRPDSAPKKGDDDDDWDNYYMACLNVGVVTGKLALFKRSYDYIEIWVLKHNDANAFWCQVLSIDRRGYRWENARPRCCEDWELKPLYFTESGKVFVKDKESVVVYDLNEKGNKNLTVQGMLDLSQMDTILLHCPSLVPLESGLHVEIVFGNEVEEGAP